ncbi:MAG: glycosyltransferase family 4 protein [Planctomycetota bacterium]|nr:glycosyltransferase family 4 protein [Planctomycetota bacterium]
MEPNPELRRTKLLKAVFPVDEPAVTAPPLRVLMISAAGELGGAERSFCEVITALPREKIEPHACVPPDSQLARALASAQVPVHEVALRLFRRSLHPLALAGNVRALYQGSRSIAEVCRKAGIEMLHANTNSAALVGWEVARMTKLPFVWHCRDMAPLHGLARILASSAAAVVAISAAVEEQLMREGVKREKITRIDNGIDLGRMSRSGLYDAVRAQMRAKLGIQAHRPVLLSVGAYVPWKKHELFLDALALVRRRLPAVGLLVGSDRFGQNEAYVASLRMRARHLALNDDALKVLDEREDVPDLMAASDVFVSCSENEPFGRVLTEAGASGLPVVATRSGAKPEIIADQVTGILTEPGDAAALAAACLKLLGDPALRQEMGRAAQERVEKLFDVRRAARELTALFQRCAAQRQAGPRVPPTR